MKTFLRISFIILLFSFCSPLFSTRFLSNQELRSFAREVEKQSDGKLICSVQGRYMVMEAYLLDNSLIHTLTKDESIKSIEESVATMCVSKCIGIKYIYYYFDDFGNERTHTIVINPIEMMCVGGKNREKVSLKGHPKSLGVNIEVDKPKGWKQLEANGPHIVQRFETEDGLSFYVQIAELPTFLSKNESRTILSGTDLYGISVYDLLEGYKEMDGFQILDCQNDVVNGYPSLRIRCQMKTSRQGILLESYINEWIVLVEDHLITLHAGALMADKDEYDYFDNVFTSLISGVYFPDQFQN